MIKPRSIFNFSFVLLASLSGLSAHAAEPPKAPPSCAGTVVAPAAARPRMTLSSVKGASDGRAVLSWEAVPGATEYRVFREPRCPTQTRIQVAAVRGDVNTWTDPSPQPMAFYSVESTQSPGTGIGRLSNGEFFDAAKAAANKTPAAPKADVAGPKPLLPGARAAVLATPPISAAPRPAQATAHAPLTALPPAVAKAASGASSATPKR
jgi:hypothetical protein